LCHILDKLLRPLVFEIDLDALRHNFLETQRLVGNDVKIICALKCNAYGFGALEAAEEVASAGAYGVAVADLYEAVHLRQQGIRAPIILYANNLLGQANSVIEFNLIPTITDLDAARIYSDKAEKILDVFTKIDVGLNRVGIAPEKAIFFIEKCIALKNIRLAGVYTHFHFSEDDEYMNWQHAHFLSVLGEIEAKGINVPIKMAAATPSILQNPQTYLNCVDPGRLIFGNPVVKQPRQEIDLKPVFRSFKTRIIERKTLTPRTQFNELRPFPVKGNKMIGVIPVGWGDGYSRAHSSIGPALLHGKRVAVLGDVDFEHTRIDLTDIPEAQVGDEVVLIGKQGNDEITLQEIAKIRNTDLHDVCQSIRQQVPRLYIKDKKPYRLKTLLIDENFQS
jgi:alanine racemase